MAAITTAQEYAAIREAIQTLTATGQRTVSVSVDGMQLSYAADQLPLLQKREELLARRLTIRNARKRTVASFGGGANYLDMGA